MNKLYIEYRVYFAPDTNQDLLHILAEAAQEEIYAMFENARIEHQAAPSPHDVTHEVIMLVEKPVEKAVE